MRNRSFFSLRGEDHNALYGSQPNIAHILNQSSSTNKKTAKLTKTQSFKHQKSDGLSTPKFLKKLSFRGSRSKDNTTKTSKKVAHIPDSISENQIVQDFNRNANYIQANSRDVTSAVVDHKGGKLVNEYWGVSLEIPEYAIEEGLRQEVYFVITDPRLCEHAPPLDLENGIYFCSLRTLKILPVYIQTLKPMFYLIYLYLFIIFR